MNRQTSYFKLTPLARAVRDRKPDFVQPLLDAKADVNLKDYEGNPPLFRAVRQDVGLAKEWEEKPNGRRRNG